MREFASPLTVDVPAGSLTDALLRNAADHPDAPALAHRAGNTWQDVSTAQLLAEVRAAARGLIAAGVEPGDRVALLSRTRFEWTILDYAIWYAGAVTVPIFATAAADQVRTILAHSGARAIIVETPAHTALVNGLRNELPELRHTWELDGNAMSVLGALGGDVDDDTLETARSSVHSASPATVIYTSGTTGSPKGCLLTHGNVSAEVATACAELGELFEPGSSTLLVLPLAHVFARVIQVGAITERVRLGHSPTVATMVDDLRSFRPTFLLGVPRLFERLVNEASQQAAVTGHGARFDRGITTAIETSQAEESLPGRISAARLRARRLVAERTVWRPFRDLLGGACRYAVSGGAPLGERLAHFYRGVGVPILEGYGLTETCAAITLGTPTASRIGTVGRPLPGVTVRIADDGELLVTGPQVMPGYWADPSGTAAIIRDGWLHTGDLGEIDDEGFVRITGRKKEILVTTGGKSISPASLEDRLREHPLVSQCIVVGDGRPYLAALVTLDPQQFAAWAAARGLSPDVSAHTHDPELVAEIQLAVDAANRTVSHAEAIRRFAILPTEWTEEAGLVTPSLKLRRNAVLRAHRTEVAALFET
ncbi:MAG: AMP-dependent synthetase/ligase [Nocardioidaceae bacterium]